MAGLKRPAGAYMAAVGTAVAVYFIINPFLSESFDVITVWYVLDVLMVIGLGLALVFNFIRKHELGKRDPEGPITRPYLEVHVAFYLTAAITILFLHNWFSLLALGEDSLDGNHQAWVIWAAVDTMVPLVLGVTGCRLWCEASRS